MSRHGLSRLRPLLEPAGMVGVLAALVLFFGWRSENFLTVTTFRTLANEIPALTVMAVGMTFVLVIAGIDLSVGSVLALAGAVLGILVKDKGLPLPVAVLGCLAAALTCGLLNGAVTVAWRIPPFIVTLGMLEIARGAAYWLTGSGTKYTGSALDFFSAPVPGLGLSLAFFVALAVVISGQIILSFTVFGRRTIAMGSNEQAARLSGVKPAPIKIAIFGASGLLAGLGAMFQCARLSAADPNAAVGMELSVIAAVVIGGTSLMGGRGSVVNSFLGVLIISVLQAGLAQLGASEPTKRVVTGAVIVAAVIIDAYRHGAAGPLAWLRKGVRRGGRSAG